MMCLRATCRCCMSRAVQQLLVASLNGFADGDGDSTIGPEERELGELGGVERKGVGEFPEWCSSVHGDATRCLLRSACHPSPPLRSRYLSVSFSSPRRASPQRTFLVRCTARRVHRSSA